ncbi:MAG: ABC transporter permease [Gammaproteobacteria bacterium]
MWDKIITSKKQFYDLNLGELVEYRDLLYMLVKRDIITVYKQTIFGPIWFVIQPLLTMLVYIVVFTNIADIPTDEIPPALFYLSGIIMWNFFSDCFNQTSDTFYENASLYGKVYFPRVIIPVSKIVSVLIKFAVQFLLFLFIYGYLLISSDLIKPNIFIMLLPVLLVIMAMLSLGMGLFFTSVTAKYRDLKFVITYAVQLLMFATPVIYPVSLLSEKYQTIMYFNPLSHVMESFKYGFLGKGELSMEGLMYAALFSFVTLIVGVIAFNRTEKNFMDTI